MNLRSVTAKGGTTGKIISIAATDCEFLVFPVITPFVFIGAIIILYVIIGPSGFVAVGVMMFYLVILWYVARW
jgi:hypothetical protein